VQRVQTGKIRKAMKKLLLLLAFLPMMAVGQSGTIAVDTANIWQLYPNPTWRTNQNVKTDTIPVIMLVCDTSRQDSGYRTVTLYQDTGCDLIFHHVSDSILTNLLLRSSIGKSKPVKSWDIIYQYDYKVFWMKGYKVISRGLITSDFGNFLEPVSFIDENKKPVKYLVWDSKEVK
jgi:hypothetical protein